IRQVLAVRRSSADGHRWFGGILGAQDFCRAHAGDGLMRPLEGIRVLEVAMYGFVPSAGAVLAEWGADVIKVEHAVTGDPQRGLRQTGLLRVEADPTANLGHPNRRRRSAGRAMPVPEAKEVLCELPRRSDVF